MSEAMQLTVRGKQIDIGDALRAHVDEVLSGTTEKYFTNAIEANVVFAPDAYLIRADISVHVGRNILLQSFSEAADPYLAFDQAAEKMDKRLRRYKRRLRDHHKEEGGPSLPAQAYVLEAEQDDGPEDREEPQQPIIIADMSSTIDDLTVSQAVMRLDLGDLPALMFRNRAHGRLNMVYRRQDRNIGWIDPRSDGESSA
jgi:ribosomal subunit interface protein